MLAPGSRVLIAGVSARAFAMSAARAGYRVTAIDAFGDADLRAAADVVALRRDAGSPFTTRAAARAARALDAAAVAYGASFENDPDAIAELATGRRLLGNPPAVVRAVRQPVALMRVLERSGFMVPVTRASTPAPAAVPMPERRGTTLNAMLGTQGGWVSFPRSRWLLKPRRSGGGHGTQRWRRGDAVPRRAYVQEWIAGVPGSITFVADGRRAVPIGLSRQLVGEPAFGVRGFRYCGSLVGGPDTRLFARGDEVRAVAVALADAVTAAFGLVGLNGIDFIARDGVAYPIEVNPRYSASMELFERAYRISMFELHTRACAGKLPARTPWPQPTGAVYGKAIVFARRTMRLGDTSRWLDARHADVPHAGERIARGHPICTVFADGRDARGCVRALARRSAAVMTSGTTTVISKTLQGAA